MANIYKSFIYKMAAKIIWHRYGTKLRHYHHTYSVTSLACCIRHRITQPTYWQKTGTVLRGQGICGLCADFSLFLWVQDCKPFSPSCSLFFACTSLAPSITFLFRKTGWILTVLFCSLAVLDLRVGHTMDVLSRFIPVLCHSD